MGYDLHLVRTSHWTEAAEDPITWSELEALVEADAEVSLSASDWLHMKDETGAVTRVPAIAWKGVSCFWWHRDQILCSGPGEAQAKKLVRIAAALNARVVGNDGERYGVRKTLFGKENLVRL